MLNKNQGFFLYYHDGFNVRRRLLEKGKKLNRKDLLKGKELIAESMKSAFEFYRLPEMHFNTACLSCQFLEDQRFPIKILDSPHFTARLYICASLTTFHSAIDRRGKVKLPNKCHSPFRTKVDVSPSPRSLFIIKFNCRQRERKGQHFG